MPAKYGNIQEEELKNKVAHDYFANYDSTPIIGKIDFCIAVPQDGAELFETESLLWAEAKAGTKKDIYESFVQLILTIGKARTFDQHLPPTFLGAFDAEKIAFLSYTNIIDVFYQNDFNWNVTPSDHETKEFKQLYEQVKSSIERDVLLYRFDTDDKELHKFIRSNFIVGKSRLSKIRINKNNFTHVYQKWVKEVKAKINIDWDVAQSAGILDVDFYFADLLSKDNLTLKDKLFVLLKNDHYILDRRINDTGLKENKIAEFQDNGIAHAQFWNRYSRPPKREYWNFMIERRDMLVPQDVRERKGSYFTPQKWVELSQQYLAAELGENWQDEYTVWDCAAGTGNLLNGLTNKYNIWASTLDQADVDVMHDRIVNGANLLDSHVFQFDFLNDPFNKLPQPLQDIINNEEKRKKLVIYINPPYAEAANKRTVTGNGENKTNVAVKNLMYEQYSSKIGIAGRELFAQFFIRIYYEIPSSVLAEFSKLKILQAPNFRDFRATFRAKLGRNFCVPADTFDNVKGKFPIGFFIWHLNQKEDFQKTVSNVYEDDGVFLGTKTISVENTSKSINDWIIETRNRDGEKRIGYMSAKGNDFQNTNYNFIINEKKQLPHPRGTWITDKNIKEISIYFAVRHCIEPTWLNDRDQFLYPNDGWQVDEEFQSDCLAYTLFNNNIQSQYGVNHWIPFTEQEVDAKEKFESHFMSNYIAGKWPTQTTVQGRLWDKDTQPQPILFSPEAQAVLNAGRKLWCYYHTQSGSNPNAALYDIRLYFQGTNDKGKMNVTSTDKYYNSLIITLRQRLKELAGKIEPKVYEYGFLLK
ncbi:hypothetical protein [uncultured Mediterranea sp.]|uniref:hypothetical protein n=1 Tax=uncultured Mediterranea sp. TaxID=1926662 RepID=UPI0027D95A6B|nr:hypothetical protein [uncultured Mediterranea sp.]